jgi:glycosyltransferase involved in cell wall biosynthesis
MQPGRAVAGVSVIVRTMGRATLPRTFASLAAQSLAPAEIVFVDSSGTGIEPPPSAFAVTVVRERGHRFDRARAANAALAAARGEWIAFLDEDDELDPRHYETLLAAVRASGLPVAYSQTRLVGSDGTERLLGGPFHRLMLFQSNYMAIHAPVFHRSFIDAGCRFDVAFEVFEDWDFWLQLAMRTAFAFTGQPTAIYHVDAGASGVGGGANLDRAAALRSRERLMAKWAPARAALELLG